jgi:3-hydroxyacyl-[acyl-carrier-protein] dehydratase
MNSLSTKQILKILPHRYPFLMVDKVLDYDDNSIVAIKNFTINEPYVQGHFPGKYLMPGVMLMEAMAQASTILVYKNVEHKYDVEKVMANAGERSGILFVAAEEVKFKKMVLPGDQLHIHSRITRSGRNLYEFEAYIKVEDTVVATVSKLKSVYSFENHIQPWSDPEYIK